MSNQITKEVINCGFYKVITYLDNTKKKLFSAICAIEEDLTIEEVKFKLNANVRDLKLKSKGILVRHLINRSITGTLNILKNMSDYTVHGINGGSIVKEGEWYIFTNRTGVTFKSKISHIELVYLGQFFDYYKLPTMKLNGDDNIVPNSELEYTKCKFIKGGVHLGTYNNFFALDKDGNIKIFCDKKYIRDGLITKEDLLTSVTLRSKLRVTIGRVTNYLISEIENLNNTPIRINFKASGLVFSKNQNDPTILNVDLGGERIMELPLSYFFTHNLLLKLLYSIIDTVDYEFLRVNLIRALDNYEPIEVVVNVEQHEINGEVIQIVESIENK